MYPDFLVIGVPRAGTTWLYHVLREHPQVFLPGSRKEIHYFDRNYHRGAGWYARFFEGAAPGQRVGEITPGYLYAPEAPVRIDGLGSVRQLVVIFRDPIERAISHYRWRKRHDAYTGSFEKFVADYPSALDWGRYHHHLARFEPWLREGRLYAMQYERLFKVPELELGKLAAFLEIESGPLESGFIRSAVNRSTAPRLPGLWRRASRIARRLRDADHDWLVNLATRLGLKRALQSERRDEVHVPAALREQLREYFRPEIEDLSRLTGLDLDDWLQPCGTGTRPDSTDKGFPAR